MFLINILPLIIQVDLKTHLPIPGELRSPLFQRVCNGNIKGLGNKTKGDFYFNTWPRCHLVHHFSPYLMLGPFHLDVKLYHPFRTVIHDFFTEKEMVWMKEHSKPRLTASRKGTIPKSSASRSKADRRHSNTNKVGYTVGKAVTTWFNDIEYIEQQKYVKISPEGRKPVVYEHPPLKDPYTYKIHFDAMHSISKKIELATNFNVTTRHGASDYQTTNYGLSGLVVVHSDPWGYEQGIDIPEDRKELTRSGDIIATVMGWFEDTQAGGGTAFVDRNYEGVIEPTKGLSLIHI